MRHFVVPKLANNFIVLHDQSWIDRQRIAGKCLSDVMMMLEQCVVNKTQLTLLELNKFAEDEIIKRNCVPTFLNYKGFPASVCISVNKQLVHGIPTDYKLEEGDVVSFDFGATFEGAIADSATTLIYGEPKSKEHIRLIETAQKCLYNAIRAIKPGLHIGVIGNAIFKTARDERFNVIETLGGHGIDENKVHANPFIANRMNKEDGPRMQPGLSIAIEPLLVPYTCSTKTKLSTDRWTISTDEISAHVEHTLFLHDDHIEIMSHRENEAIEKNILY